MTKMPKQSIKVLKILKKCSLFIKKCPIDIENAQYGDIML